MILVRMLTAAAIVLLLSTCRGWETTTTQHVDRYISPPENLHLDSSARNSLTVSWSPVQNAEGYNLYIATESIDDIQNYGAFAGGQMLTDVSSPYEITGLDLGTKYFVRVSAVFPTTNSTIESTGSNEVNGRALIGGRYVPIDNNGAVDLDGDYVRDYVNYLDWERCPQGMSWSADNDQCEGTAITSSNVVYVGEYGWRLDGTYFVMPTTRELMTLVYCDDPLGYFNDYDLTQACVTAGDPAVYPGVFTGMPTDLSYSATTIIDMANAGGYYWFKAANVDFSTGSIVDSIFAQATESNQTIFVQYQNAYIRKVRLAPRP